MTPVTLPEPSTVAFELLLAHVPVVTSLLRLETLPTHIKLVPCMPDGRGLTVTVVVLDAIQPAPGVVTVTV